MKDSKGRLIWTFFVVVVLVVCFVFVVVSERFYTALFSALEQTHRARMLLTT